MSSGTYQGWFYFEPDDPIYAGHFPGAAVVPGTLIIEAFLARIEQMGIAATGLNRFRFKSFATPGLYVYEVVVADRRVRCRLLQEGREVAEGTILYDR